jgi:hypothetical protein
VGDNREQRTLGATSEADEVVRVVFKAELEADEEPVGRIAIVRSSELREDRASDSLPGRPYTDVCVCWEPEGDPGEPCRRCGRDNERWVGLIEAEEIARRRGAPLVEL